MTGLSIEVNFVVIQTQTNLSNKFQDSQLNVFYVVGESIIGFHIHSQPSLAVYLYLFSLQIINTAILLLEK